jgi:hypothetical protein
MVNPVVSLWTKKIKMGVSQENKNEISKIIKNKLKCSQTQR